MIYLATTLLSTALAFTAVGKSRKQNLILAILAVLPFCVLAAVREITVGTDTSGYPWFLYWQATGLDFLEFCFSWAEVAEPFYLITTWLVTNIFGSFTVLLFILEMLVVVPVAITAHRETPDEIPLVYFMFGCIFFGTSLNIIRQSIAMSFTLLSISYLMRRDYGKAALCGVVASGFHLTGIISFLLLLYIYLTDYRKFQDENRQKQARHFIYAFSLLGSLLIVLFGKSLINLLAGIKESYSYQVEHLGLSEGFDYKTLFLGIMLPCILLYKKIVKKTELRRIDITFAVLLCSGGIVSQLTVVSPEMIRVGLFVLTLTLLAFPRMSSTFNNGERQIYRLLVVAVSLTFFFIAYIKGNSGGIMPFEMTSTLLR